MAKQVEEKSYSIGLTKTGRCILHDELAGKYEEIVVEFEEPFSLSRFCSILNHLQEIGAIPNWSVYADPDTKEQ